VVVEISQNPGVTISPIDGVDALRNMTPSVEIMPVNIINNKT
jgi:hypothetical protein